MKKYSLIIISLIVLLSILSSCFSTTTQVAIDGEDYEYHLYNTHIAATEDYILARTAMGDTYLIPTSDNTRMEGSCQLDIDLNLFCGFDIGGDTVFFTNKGKVYSIKIDDLVTKAIHGRPILEDLKPAVDGSFPKYKDGKLYVTDMPESSLETIYDLADLKKHTTSVYDVTVSPWELVEQGTDVLYPEYDQPDLSKAQVQLDDKRTEMLRDWFELPHSPDNPFSFITNYDNQWIYYAMPYSLGIYRAPYSSEKYDETNCKVLHEYFPNRVEFAPDSFHSTEGDYVGYTYLDVIDGWIYYPAMDGGIYRVNNQNFNNAPVLNPKSNELKPIG